MFATVATNNAPGRGVRTTTPGRLPSNDTTLGGDRIMPKNQRSLASLAIEALDEFERLRSLQQVLEVIIDLFHNSDENLILRVELLLDMYRASADNHLDQMRVCLETLYEVTTGKLIGDRPVQPPEND